MLKIFLFIFSNILVSNSTNISIPLTTTEPNIEYTQEITQTSIHTSTQTIINTSKRDKNYYNYCGLNYDNIDCNSSCINGIDSECENGKKCFNTKLCHDKKTTYINNPTSKALNLINRNYCGLDKFNIDCNQPCINGLISDCVNDDYDCFNSGDFCLKDFNNTENFCGLNVLNIDCQQPCPKGLKNECFNPDFDCFNVGDLCNSKPTINSNMQINSSSVKNSISKLLIIFSMYLYTSLT